MTSVVGSVLSPEGDGIQVEGLCSHYRSGAGIVDISFNVPFGSVVALVGGNGAGKSTLLDCIGTLRSFEAGTVRLGRYELPAQRCQARAQIGMAGQSTGLDPVLTVEQNLQLFASLAGLRREAKARRMDEVVAALELAPSLGKPVEECSGGTRRRADLAIALLRRPAVLLLDEPTTGLDPMVRGAFWRAVAAERDRGAAVLFATQYLNEVSVLAERVVLLQDGRVVESAEPRDLLRRIPGGRVYRVSVGEDEFEHAAATLHPVAVTSRGDGRSLVCILRAGVTPTRLLAALEEAGIELHALSEEKATLDDVFHLAGQRHQAIEGVIASGPAAIVVGKGMDAG